MGHGANGRLGTGKTERYGVPDKEKYYFPVPSLLSTLVYKAKERFFFVGLNSFFPILLGENSSGVLWLRLYFSHWSVWGEKICFCYISVINYMSSAVRCGAGEAAPGGNWGWETPQIDRSLVWFPA